MKFTPSVSLCASFIHRQIRCLSELDAEIKKIQRSVTVSKKLSRKNHETSAPKRWPLTFLILPQASKQTRTSDSNKNHHVHYCLYITDKNSRGLDFFEKAHRTML